MSNPANPPIPAASAAVYAAFYPGLKKVAEEHGYALTIHGSLTRDFDLVAIPWTREATDAETVIEALNGRIGGYFKDSDPNPCFKPHGRRAYSIHFDGGPYLDVSVMPRMREVLQMACLRETLRKTLEEFNVDAEDWRWSAVEEYAEEVNVINVGKEETN